MIIRWFKSNRLKLIYYLWTRIILWYRNVEYKTFPIINGKLFIYGHGKIYMGSNVQINSCLAANPIGGDTRTIISIDRDAILEIGSNTGISNAAIICTNKITIGSFVKIGGSVKIYDTDFHSLDPELRKNAELDVPLKKSVVIGDNCFVGAHSIILKGVTIGENSIIGAGSVVAKSIPPDEIWGGNPAKFIKIVSRPIV